MEFFRRTPLFGVLAALVAGIVGSSFFGSLSAWVLGACSASCFVFAAVAFPRRPSRHGRAAWPAWVYTVSAIVFFGAFVGRFSEPRSVVPQGVRLSLEVVIDDFPRTNGGRAMHTSGRLVSAGGERLLVSFDTVWRFSLGDRVRYTGYVNSIDSSQGGYGRLMHARGFTGRTYISRYSAPLRVGKQDRYFFRRLQSSATSRLARLDLSPDGQAIAAAMTTGSRTNVSRPLRAAYSRTGAAHLLAVSGLHVGVIFLIINGLLYFLPLVRGGRVLKNILAVAAIWVYAAVTGMSPSVTRAAVMFSGAQLAVAVGVRRSAANILCGTAVIMLSLRPSLVFDVSFQLSFLAVAGIMCWFSAIYGLVRSRWRLLNALWSTLIVGFTASVATMPLVSHVFGVISPLGVLLNPVLMITAWVLVSFSAVWILVPWGVWAPLFRWSIGGAAEVQNAVIQRVSEIPGVAIELRLSGWCVCAIYGAFIMLSLWIARKKT